MRQTTHCAPLWQPSAQRIAEATITHFMRGIAARFCIPLPDYAALWQWSTAHPEDFWSSWWDYAGVIGTRGDRVVIDGERMPGARWFPDAELNFAENLLHARAADDEADALVFRGEDKVLRRTSHRELVTSVAKAAAALKVRGITQGDRIAGYLPNMPETILAMLAGASVGAVWSSCSPDFGVRGVLDRFSQIEPKVLFTVDGYWYNGKALPIQDKVREIVAQLPSVEHVVIVPYLEQSLAKADTAGIPHAVSWDAFLDRQMATAIDFVRLPFEHPLYILYSSGTTGVPKCIVHGAGGTLLQHLKEHRLHTDIKSGDRLFYFTTCGWMMWNWLVSGLGSGATLLLFDGSPFCGRGRILWDYAQAERMTHFGTSAKYIDAIKKIELAPRDEYDLSALRTILSTGSPLAPEAFDYVYAHVKDDVCLSSISGGTDIISCFALGSPILPVWRGELQCRGLGMAVDVFDPTGTPLPEEKGELVCTKPFPSMPIGFWNDRNGSKYHAAYFQRFPNVWYHGDYVQLTEHDGLIVHGRSDATLNPGGVRIGTAEIYRQVEQLDDVVESLVIGQDWPPQQPNDVRVILFVRLRDGATLDDTLIDRIKQQIRVNTTPRHVPAKIVQVTDIPRTKSGKIVELAVRNAVHGIAVENVEALANAEALDQFRGRKELQSA